MVLPPLREQFSIPIVGTVSQLLSQRQKSHKRNILVYWQQRGTVKRPYVNDLIHQFAAHCVVERLGSTKLVEIAEHKIQREVG